MMIHLFYRKKDHPSSNYPWTKLCDGPVEAVKFIESLGDEYDFIPFEQIDLGDLLDMADMADMANNCDEDED